MRIDIEGDDLIRAAGDPAAKRIIRSAAYFLLAAIGDIPDETEVHTATGAALDAKLSVVPMGTNECPRPGATPAPFVPAVATAAGAPVATGVADAAPKTVPAASNVLPFPPPPPPPTDSAWISQTREFLQKELDEMGAPNTGNVPPPPPPPDIANTAATTGAASSVPTTAPHAPYAEGASAVVSAEVDAAGLPWDERIHQKGKSKKKDNTWKLKKGIDPAVVVAVTTELAARKASGGYNPAQDNASQLNANSGVPTAGSLLAGSNTVPVPPVPNGAVASGVPAPNGVGSSVPVPPAPPVGSVGASDATPYRKLIDKITDLTKAGKLTPAKVSEICTSHGSPSLMALKQFEALIPAVDKDIDAAALGLM